jgi:hypothetical protein
MAKLNCRRFAALSAVTLLLLVAGEARPFDPYDPSQGYCGPHGQSLPPELEPLFNRACYSHDECYNQCENTGRSKADCDNQFLRDMRKSCTDFYSYPPDREDCFKSASRHYRAVSVGAGAFHSYNCTPEQLEAAITPVLKHFTVNGVAGPIDLAPGGVATLSWNAIRVSDCAAYGDWSGPRPPSGSQQVGPLQSSRIYTLMCRNTLGRSVTSSVEIRVGTGGGAGGGTGTGAGTAPWVELKLNGATGTVGIGAGQPAELTWSSRGTAHCYASQGWSGEKRTGGGRESVGPLEATTTYVLTCNNSAGIGATQSVTANVLPPTVELKINGGTSPVDVAAGGTATLTWSSRYATSCTASGGWSGSRSTSGGSQRVGPITATTMYTLYCTNSVGENAGTSVTARIGATGTGSGTGSGGGGSGTGTGGGTGSGSGGTGATGTPTVELRINGGAGPASLGPDENATLSWTASNAVSCSAYGGWTGGRSPTGGTETIGPIRYAKSYGLRCRNSLGKTATATVRAIPAASGSGSGTGASPPPAVDLKVDGVAGPITVGAGGRVTLSWSVQNASTCHGSGSWSGSKDARSGSQSVGPIHASKTYTLVCRNSAGTSVSRSVRVNVATTGR